VRTLTPWPRPGIRRASVNSFGYGGANGHCILESPTTSDRERSVASPVKLPRLVVLPFSAQDHESLTSNIAATKAVISQNNVLDIAYTLSERRSRFRHKAFVIVTPRDPHATWTSSNPIQDFGDAPRDPRMAFIFTGMFAQAHRYVSPNMLLTSVQAKARNGKVWVRS